MTCPNCLRSDAIWWVGLMRQWACRLCGWTWEEEE
jgi:hypothetical protein